MALVPLTWDNSGKYHTKGFSFIAKRKKQRQAKIAKHKETMKKWAKVFR